MVNQITLKPPEKLDAIFAALANSTRRGILEIVVKTESNATALAKQFNISSPAISKHLKVLQNAGLVALGREGRNRRVAVNIHQLNEATEWINSYTKFWHDEISNLEQFLDTESTSD
jgi:DNA-binding transcriptional ArsR family regulator